jgi:CheY-like chemotaxis protein
MTANVLMSEVETYFAAGMNDHIGKPVDFDKLIKMLNSYFR